MKYIATLLFSILLILNSTEAKELRFDKDSVFIVNQSIDTITTLDLSDLGLKEIPKNLSSFSALKKIDLSNNRLHSVEGIAVLEDLEELILDGNPTIIASSLNGEINQLSSLKKLSIANSKLLYIPYSVFNVLSLEELDLHGNRIEIVSFEIGKLKKLKTLDLSDNEIEFIDNGIQGLRQLHNLKLSNNNILNVEHLLLQLSNLSKLEELTIGHYNVSLESISITSLKKVTLVGDEVHSNSAFLNAFSEVESVNIEGDCKEEELAHIIGKLSALQLKDLTIINDEIKLLPDNVFELKQLEVLSLECNLLESIPTSINRMGELRSMQIRSSKMDLNTTVNRLIPLKKLEKLTLVNWDEVQLPTSISKLNELKEFKLEAASLGELPKSFKMLDQLNRAEIIVSNAEIKNLDYLKQEMPACEFIIASAAGFAMNKVLDPPLESVDVEFDEYIIDAKEAQRIVTPSKSEIIIPANAFLDKEGKPVKENVRIVYREFADPIDMVFAGIPMTETRGGETYTFSSAGMMEFRAFQQNEELFPNPDQPITINYNSPFQGNNYDLFYLDPTTEKWESIGKDSISRPQGGGTPTRFADRSIEMAYPQRPEYPRFPYDKAKLKMSLDYDKKRKHTRLYISNPAMRTMRRDTMNMVFSELKHFSRMKWKVDNTDKTKEELKELKALFDNMSLYDARANRLLLRKSSSRYKWGQLRYIEDFWLEPNPEKDNFNVVLSKSGELIKIPVVPLKMPSKPEVAQKKVRHFYLNYKKNLAKRKSDWVKVERVHEKNVENYALALEQYEDEMVEYRKEVEWYNRAEIERLKEFPASEENVMRSFTLSNFGMFNCDILQRMQEPMQILASLRNKAGEKLNAKKIYVLDIQNNGLLTFQNPNQAFFEFRHNNSLIAILPGNKIAVLSSKDFDPEKLITQSAQVSLKVYDMKETTIAELRKDADFF